MELELQQRIISSELESPFNDFKVVDLSVEIRICPLSGRVTRLLPFRTKQLVRHDFRSVIERSKAIGCPFCPESLESKVARFSKDFGLEGGHIRFKDTTIFPNAYPYERFSAVAVFTREHFLTPRQFSPEILAQGLEACQIYFKNVKTVAPEIKLALIDWNYMPMAGAGLVHPHIQPVALNEPTFHYRLIMESQARYNAETGRSMFDDLVAIEQEDGRRYMAQIGEWHWTAAFAPRGIYEFWAVYGGDVDVLEMTPDDFWNLASGIHAILSFFEDKGVQAFNLCLYSFYKPSLPGLRNLLAIIPRVNYLPVGMSDINYFDRLHGESITFNAPEDAAGEARGYFVAVVET